MSLRMDDFRCQTCARIDKDVAYEWDTDAQGAHATHAALTCRNCGGVSRVVWLQGRARFGGLGRRTSSGESLAPSERYLAGLHFGRPVQTEGELQQLLKQHNMHRGTVGEWHDMIDHSLEAKAAPAPTAAELTTEEMDATLAHMAQRREIFRSKYDAGEVPTAPQYDLPLEVRSQMPTEAAVSAAAAVPTGE